MAVSNIFPVVLAAALSVLGTFVVQLVNQVNELKEQQDRRHQYIAQLQSLDEEVDLLRHRVRELEQEECRE